MLVTVKICEVCQGIFDRRLGVDCPNKDGKLIEVQIPHTLLNQEIAKRARDEIESLQRLLGRMQGD